MPRSEDVIRTVNERHRTTWEIVDRLAGGYSSFGAYLLRSKRNEAVLKVHPPGRTEQRQEATARAVESAIEAGWRTPRWLAHGLLPGGEWYVVREFVPGSRPQVLGTLELQLILDTNRRQSDLQPEIDADWSQYVRRVVVEATSPHAPRLRTRADTSALLDRVLDMVARATASDLATADLVHGDLTLENTIVSEGAAYLIDAEFLGKGSRAYDLATLLVHASTGEIGASAATITRLRAECVALVGLDGTLLCAATRILGLVDFGFDHWSTDIPRFIARANAFLDMFV
jgi:hypothetical protein